MALADTGPRRSELGAVMRPLSRWLLRHLDDPDLLYWVIRCGGQLHEWFASLIECRFTELDKLEKEGRTAELAHIRENAPNAIPCPVMHILWCLILSGQVKPKILGQSFHFWCEQFKCYGLTTSVRFALRQALRPYLSLREPSRLDGRAVDKSHVRSIVGWEVVLASSDVSIKLSSLTRSERWKAALPELLGDFNSLLRDAISLMDTLGGVDGESERTCFQRPSIADHPQNRDYYDWTVLIQLARDAWLATASNSPERARAVAEIWARESYSVFRRLAFFVAVQEGSIIPLQQAIDWLLADDRRWLWAKETTREAIRLLVFLGPQLDIEMQDRLDQAILLGPPRDLFPADIERKTVDSYVWLRLAKMVQAGATLSRAGELRLKSLSIQYPELKLEEDERDEFSFWMIENAWEGVKPSGLFTFIPRTISGMLVYLRANPRLGDRLQEDWRKLCSETFVAPVYALCKLSRENFWPVDYWRAALHAWWLGNSSDRSWHYLAPVVDRAPDEWVQSVALEISRWLGAIPKPIGEHKDHFINLVQRILELASIGEIVTEAINHPIGVVTEVLLEEFYSRGPSDNQGLPQSIKSIFTGLCDTQITKFRYGRVLLAAHIVALFRVDEVWAQTYLIPLFDWRRSEIEAQAAWKGFLWTPRLYSPLMETMKTVVLDTASHYEKLGEHGSQFAAFITLAALDPQGIFTTKELANSIDILPTEGLNAVLRALVEALKSAADQRKSYWNDRILPFWDKIWPKSKDRVSGINAERIALLCIESGDAFPSAIEAVGSWLRVVKDPHYVINCVQEAGLCQDFPKGALYFLSVIVGDQLPWWVSELLGQCLKTIGDAEPLLSQGDKFKRLDELMRGANV